MGGGAGVNFTVRIDGFHFTVLNDKVNPINPLTINSWDCEGYMDGMLVIRGNMLTVKSLQYDLDDNDKSYLEQEQVESDTMLYCSSFKVENMEWGGYMRGKWQDAFPMYLRGRAELEYLGEVEISIEIDVADREEFEEFWQDIFESYADEDAIDEDGNKIGFETQYEWMNFDNRVNYGTEESILQRTGA